MTSMLWLFTLLLIFNAYIVSQMALNARKGPPLTNTECLIYYDPDKVLTPSSLDEIQGIIQRARDKGQKIRPLGSGHSWNTMALADDLYISLYNYRGLVSVNAERKQITVRGGTRLWEINQYAAQHGLALSVLPSISNQTIGGALATGTHGSGINFGNLPSYVTELELVTGTGEVLSLTPEADPVLFQAAGVSLGLLGIITEVTLQCEDAFNLLEVLSHYPLSYCLEHMTSLAKEGEHVKFWIELNSEMCFMFSANRTLEKPRNIIPQPLADIKTYIYEVLQCIWSVLPATANIGMNLLFTHGDPVQERNRVDHSWQVLNIPHYIDQYHRESEIAVPINDCPRAIRDVMKVKKDHDLPVNHIIEVRFVKKDTFWLSYSYQRDSCHVTLLLHNPSDYLFNLYSYSFYKETLQYGGRPHWGKVLNMSHEEAKMLYPKLSDFIEVYKEMDPDKIFLNDIAKTVFGLYN